MEAVPGSQTVTRTVTNVSAPRRSPSRPDVKAPAGLLGQGQPVVPPGARRASRRRSRSPSPTPAPPSASGGSAPSPGRARATSVRSAIAVKGVVIAAPASVTGTGTVGHRHHPGDQFGQAGTYTATPHGLVGATDNNGTVAQDPDQTYPSADDGPGSCARSRSRSAASTMRAVVAGASRRRRPRHLPVRTGRHAGGRVRPTAARTSRSTSTNPADGTYTMVVHGWAVGATPGTTFDLAVWLVPKATGRQPAR